MSRKRFVYNEDLAKEQREAALNVDVYDISSDLFLEDGWLYDNEWPTDKMNQLLDKLTQITPYSVDQDPKFFDLSIYGYSIFNQAMAELIQGECIDG